MNTFYFVRHGENRANLTREFSSKKIDYSLTSKGIVQSQQTAEYFRDKNIHEIYSSPLKRAVETAQIIAEVLDLHVTFMEQFREIDVGSLEGQTPSDENWALHDRIVNDWYEGNYESTFPNGENYWMAFQRMREGLREVLQYKRGRNIIIIGHGGIIESTIKDFCSNIVDVRQLQRTSNCAITQVAFHLNRMDLEGKMQMWAFNCHLHEKPTG